MIYHQMPLEEWQALRSACERLQHEVAELREALGMTETEESMRTLARVLKIRPSVARIIQRLYAARGRWVELGLLVETADPHARSRDGGNLARVMIHQARITFGKEGVERKDAAYRLSGPALKKIADLLDRNREAV